MEVERQQKGLKMISFEQGKIRKEKNKDEGYRDVETLGVQKVSTKCLESIIVTAQKARSNKHMNVLLLLPRETEFRTFRIFAICLQGVFHQSTTVLNYSVHDPISGFAPRGHQHGLSRNMKVATARVVCALVLEKEKTTSNGLKYEMTWQLV